MSLDGLNYELINDELMMGTQSCLSPELRLWHHPVTARDGGTVRVSGLRCSFLPLSDYVNLYISSSRYRLLLPSLFSQALQKSIWVDSCFPSIFSVCVCVSQIPSAIWWNPSPCSRNSVLNAWNKTRRTKYIEMHWPNDWKSNPLSSSPSALSWGRAELSGRFISSHHIEVFVSIIYFW